MKLKDLMEQVGKDEDVRFQINNGKDSWSVFDTFRADSELLSAFEDREIMSLTAIERDVFRFEMLDEKIDVEFV